jgi:hypothetical protein
MMTYTPKCSPWSGVGYTTWDAGGDTVLIDEGETERGVPLVHVSVGLDRKGEAWRRAVRIGLPSTGETFPKPFVVGITSKVDVDVLASGREVDVIDVVLPKMLCAEETGDAVSDL